MSSEFDSSSDDAAESSEEEEFEDEGQDVSLAQLGQMVNAGGKHLRPPGISSGESSEEEFEGGGGGGGQRQEEDEEEEEESEPESEPDDDSDEDFNEDESDEEEEMQVDEGADSDSSEDVPLASLKSPKAKKAAAPKKAAAAKKKAPAKKKSSPKPKKSSSKKKPSASAKKKAPSKSSGGGGGGGSSGDGPTLPSTALYASSEKGRLIQAVLCRWWYAVTWPDPAALKSCPPGYDALDGFPGVYVCTSGDDVGKLVDYRDKDTCPCFANYARKSSDELVGMLLRAIEVQRERLIEAEGRGTETEKELDKLEGWAKKLNTTKADRDADKVLKAAKLTL